MNTKTIIRTNMEQIEVDKKTAKMSLYHYEGCFFCFGVREAIEALNLKIELRDVRKERYRADELLEGGGSSTVPCLRRENAKTSCDEWLYESSDIVDFLKAEFGNI